MKLILALIAITATEHIAQGFITDAETWYLALWAKYLSLALALSCLWFESRCKPLLERSVVALACMWTWIDFADYFIWQASGYDSSPAVLVLWSTWLIYSVRREYEYRGDIVIGKNVFIMLLRPASFLAVCKSLFGFPVASVCIYANGCVWSYRKKSGTFNLYSVDERWLRKHIAINTGVHCSDDITQMLDDLIWTKRWPGTKCIWSIRHVLARLGKTYKPRMIDYFPGIYALRLIKGRR